MNMLRIGIIIASLGVTACAVGPTYIKPEIAVPQSYRHARFRRRDPR